jgi:hypothetical protein
MQRLWVSKVDRLTRSVAFLPRLLEAGVDVRFVDLPIAEGPTGRFMLHMLVSVAEFEAGMISGRIKAALARAKRRGVVLGGDRGHAPYTLQPRPSIGRHGRAPARRRAGRGCSTHTIRALQEGGATSLRTIAAGLNARNIPTARTRMVRRSGGERPQQGLRRRSMTTPSRASPITKVVEKAVAWSPSAGKATLDFFRRCRPLCCGLPVDSAHRPKIVRQ